MSEEANDDQEPVEVYAADRVADLVELLMLHYDHLSPAEGCNEVLFALLAYVEDIVGPKAAQEPLLSVMKALTEDEPEAPPLDADSRVIVLKRIVCDHGKPRRGPHACVECAGK